MPTKIILGGSNVEHILVVDNFSIPALDGVPAILAGFDTACTALKEAADHRVGVTLTGPKWVGKSVAIRRAITRMAADEQTLFKRMRDTYKPRQCMYVHGLDSKTPRQLLMTLIKAVLPTYRERQHGARKDDAEIRKDLVAALLNKGYAVIIFDEAEYLSAIIVDQLRKIISDATQMDTRSTFVLDGVEHYRAGGVGILLVGTPEVVDVVNEDADAGLRWSDGYTVPPIKPTDVGRVYAEIFPRFAEHITAVGEEEWMRFGELTIALGRPMPLGVITMHARKYFSLTADVSLDSDAPVRTRVDTPFVRDVFVYVLNQMSGATDAARRKAA